MRRVLTVCALALAMVCASPAAGAEPVAARYTDPDGVATNVRIPDASLLRPSCARPGPAAGRPAMLRIGESDLAAYRTETALWLRDATGSGWCRASSDLVSALESGRRAPVSRVPWLVFVLTLGGLGLAVLVIVLWGAGRGPEPTLVTTDVVHGAPASGPEAAH